MPPSLHPHLKRGLDLDGFHVDPKDIIEEPPTEYEDAEHRAAKRRRIEAIATRYLRGRPPVIITAGLRGPFNNGWKNPWAKPPVQEKKTARKSNKAAGTRNADGNKDATGERDTAGRRRSSRLRASDASVVEDRAPQTESPETSRAARDALDHREYDDSLDDIEVPPATAPLPDDDDISDTIESVSVTTARCIQNRSPMTNPFWLRRPGSTRVDMRRATNGNTDMSPTRTRSRNSALQSQTQTLAELRLSLPKAPIRARTSAPQALEQDGWRSSASAPMVISTPVKDVGISIRAQATPVANPPPQTLARTGGTPALTIATPHSSEPRQRSQRTVPIMTSSMGSQGRRTGDDVQQSAGCPVDVRFASTSKEPPRRPSRQSTQNAPSPRPVSRKTKLRPRAVNFDSPPAKVLSAKKPCGEQTAIHGEADNEQQDDSMVTITVDVQASPQVEGDVTVVQDENPSLRTSQGSRDSDWSTQAAMLRAQLEFQQSTFPMVSPEVLRLDSQTSPLDTPRPLLPIASAAVTPLSAFTVQRDEPLAPETVLQAPPISTQDLFGAASPFAFSTVKKKAEEPQRSNLRFALSPSDGVRKADAVAKSPTPTAERIPLKEKNTMASFWSFTTDKASQGSQGSVNVKSKGTLNSFGFPALNIDTSLGDFGPTGSLDFTDGFVRNIDDT